MMLLLLLRVMIRLLPTSTTLLPTAVVASSLVSAVLIWCLFPYEVQALFVHPYVNWTGRLRHTSQRRRQYGRQQYGRQSSYSRNGTNNDNSNDDEKDYSDYEQQFTIITCMSPSCGRKRNEFGLDPFATFGAMYARANSGGKDTTDANDNDNDTASSTKVNVKEGPCLGACQYGPCIGIEHDEYNGCVALEGMTEEEFSNTVYVVVIYILQYYISVYCTNIGTVKIIIKHMKHKIEKKVERKPKEEKQKKKRLH